MRPQYKLRIINRGEDIIYSDADVEEFHLQTTSCNGHRLYCSDTHSLAVNKRKSIIDNLCDYFNATISPIIFVIDEVDKDRQELELYLTNLISSGHKITIEHDSAHKRYRFQIEMHKKLLNAGKRITINGIQFDNIEDYEKYIKEN